MIFQHTYRKVLDGTKTRTTRPAKFLDWLSEFDGIHPAEVYSKCDGPFGRVRWRVGNTYAVQPGRGRPSVGRIRITGIREVTLALVDTAYARKEGFKSVRDFRQVWDRMYPDWKAGMLAWCIDFELVK